MTSDLRMAVLPDRAVVAVEGPDRVKFLQGMTTNDVRKLAPGKALYSGFLTGQGKLLYDFFLADAGERFLIDIDAGKVTELLAHVSRFKLRAAVEFPVAALAVTVAWGNGAAAKLGLGTEAGMAGRTSLPEVAAGFVDPRLAALGVRLFHPADLAIEAALAAQGFTPAADYAAHRLNLGVAGTAEIGGCYPLEANFEQLHGVDFKKGCYLGQELTARMRLKGELRKRVLPVSASVALPQTGARIVAGDSEIGTLIAAEGARGLGLLRLDRLSEAPRDAIRAQDVPLEIRWPEWLAG